MIQESLQHDHAWVCAKEGGTLGELVIAEPLSTEVVKRLGDGDMNVEQACPHGMVRCRVCGQKYEVDEEILDKELPTFRQKIKSYSSALIISPDNS